MGAALGRRLKLVLGSFGAMARVFAYFLLAFLAYGEKMRAAVVKNRSWDFKFHLEKLEVIDVEPTPSRFSPELADLVEQFELNGRK